MKNGESIQNYVSKVLAIVHQIRALGEVLTDQIVVAKLMRSLTTKFNHVVSSIMEGNDLTTLTVDELRGSLQAHEAMMDFSLDKTEDKAFAVRGKTTDSFSHTGRARGRGFFRGRVRGRGRNVEPRSAHLEYRYSRAHVQCHNCKKFGHLKA